MDWQSKIVSSNKNDEKRMLLLLIEFMNEFHLKQCVLKPTHRHGNILDLLLTNNEELIHSYHCIPVISSVTDHNLIEIATHFNSKHSTDQPDPRPLNSEFDEFNYFDENIDWSSFNNRIREICWKGSHFKIAVTYSPVYST